MQQYIIYYVLYLSSVIKDQSDEQPFLSEVGTDINDK